MIRSMRGGYDEPLAMLGYLVGMLTTPMAAHLVGSDTLMRGVLAVCGELFAIAFVFGLVHYLLRGIRRLARAVRPRQPETSP